jgi:hypothetical protein
MTNGTNVNWPGYKPVTQEGFQKQLNTAGVYTRGQSVIKKGYLKGNYPIYGPKEGENIIRIIPPLEIAELNSFAMDIWFHRNVGPNRDFLLCNKNLFGDPCYVCSVPDDRMWTEQPDVAKTYYPEHKFLIWVLDLKLPQNAEKSGYPHIWPAPKTLVLDIISASEDKERKTFINPEHPELGMPIYFTRTGTRKETKYHGVQCGRNAMPISPELSKFMCYFTEELVVLPFEEGKKMALGDSIYPETGASPMQAGPLPSGYEEVREEVVQTSRTPDCYGSGYGEYVECTDGQCSFDSRCSELVKASLPSAPPVPNFISDSTSAPEYPPDPGTGGSPFHENIPDAPPVPQAPQVPPVPPVPDSGMTRTPVKQGRQAPGRVRLNPESVEPSQAGESGQSETHRKLQEAIKRRQQRNK